MRLKADDRLFNMWRSVGREIQTLGSVVQNDIEDVDRSLFAEWKSTVLQKKRLLDEIFIETIEHIRSSNEGGSK